MIRKYIFFGQKICFLDGKLKLAKTILDLKIQKSPPKHFLPKIAEIWSFLGFLNFQIQIVLSFLVSHPKKQFFAEEKILLHHQKNF